MTKLSKEAYTQTVDLLSSVSYKYRTDAEFQGLVDSGKLDIKESFGLDVGDKEVVVTADSHDTMYFIVIEDENKVLSDSDEAVNSITGAKGLTFEQAQATLGAGSALSFGIVGLIALPFILANHPEYFYDGGAAIKTSDVYYADVAAAKAASEAVV